MTNITKSQKIFLSLILVAIVLVLLLIVGKISYSFMSGDVDDDVVQSGEVTASGDILTFSQGNALSLKATTDNFNSTSGNLTATTNPKAILSKKGQNRASSAEYHVYFHIKDNTYQYSTDTKTPELLLTILDSNGNAITSVEGLDYITSSGVSGFDITNASGYFKVADKYQINASEAEESKTQTWTFTLTFINFETDQSINEEASLNTEILLQKDEITLAQICEGKEMASCITSDYGLESTLFYHDVDGVKQNGELIETNSDQGAEDNSYRYSGASDIVNNYVCFGSNEATCPEDNLYRIIGYFNVASEGQAAEYQMKLIKAKPYVGQDAITSSYTSSGKGYYWSGSSSNSSNTWANSTLNTITLNGDAEGNYLHDLGEEWSSKIANHTWKVGGLTHSTTNTAKQYYETEVGASSSSTTYEAKVGLMYISDYGYGASQANWTTALYSYDNSSAKSNNWLYLGSYEWLISRCSSDSYYAFYVRTAGTVYGSNVYNFQYAVRPSIYLRSDVTLRGGSGSMTDPYRIA